MAAFYPPVQISTQVISSPQTRILVPQIIGLPNKSVEHKMNHEITQLAVHMQNTQLSAQSGSLQEMIGNYEIKTNERGLLSLILSNYTYSYPMAHGSTIARSLTFDVHNGRSYKLNELFKSGIDYEAVLSEIIQRQIKQRQLPLLNGFTSIRADQDYYLADKSLVIYFQQYEITPYYVGLPMFPISIYELIDIAPENSPINTLSASVV